MLPVDPYLIIPLFDELEVFAGGDVEQFETGLRQAQCFWFHSLLEQLKAINYCPIVGLRVWQQVLLFSIQVDKRYKVLCVREKTVLHRFY